ncbi:uncharacterized protein DUF1269 [Kribbella pratensis]|uniref:Uncharacterized protein DUF1269 n=1 Tax=Kribbella pratensis TaxID=2512112 RepID=A0ABY2FNK4_9ACTN|nr:DUF1269 domain-containing protein [Kribbella pratensis]TDW94729.1 uncharacterized protein DUF1269 [Kribbella pratensis]
MGALWGVLLGSLFFVPVIGGVAGAAIGAISKMTQDAGITKEQLHKIRTEVTAPRNWRRGFGEGYFPDWVGNPPQVRDLSW